MQKILSSLLTISLVTVIGVAATKAYFSDAETSTENTFTAGTMDLKLNGNNSVTATWAMSSMKPGDSVSATINLTNMGSINADHVEINSVANIITDATPLAAIPLDKKLEITALSYDGVSKLPDIVDSNGNGYKDLDDLESTVLDNLNAPASSGGSTKALTMTVSFRTDAGNEYQGDSDKMSMAFALNQDISQ